jgi:hypothetical protein
MSTEKSDVEIWDSITSGDEQPEPVVDEAPADEEPVVDEETPAEDEAPADEEPGPMESLAAMVGEIKQKLEKPAEEAPKAETKSSTPAPFVDPAERLTEEQKKALEVYDADFPEIKKAVSIEMQMFAERLLNFHHTRETQLVDEIKAALEPLVGMHSEYTAEKKQRTTRQAIPEFDEVSAWIETQPKIVRGAYQTALSEGGDSRAEVLAAFKASRQAKPVLSEAKTKALQGMKSPPKMRAPSVSDSEETQDPMEIWKKLTNGG